MDLKAISVSGLLAAAVLAAPAVAVVAPAVAVAQTASPQAVVDELLAADRAFAATGAKTDLVTALSNQFDEAVIMPLPTGTVAQGKAAAVAALRGNPENPTSRTEWAPVRGGVSADGKHGFTFGFMTITRASGQVLPAKYLAYWVRRPEGWRVAAYKRAPRPEGAISTAMMAPSLPDRIVPETTDPAVLNAQRASLAAAEKAFSDDAQTMGLSPAFGKWGRDDAMNMGRDPGFTIGAKAIEASGGQTGPAPVNWSSQDVLVASSGDLGVSWGVIVANPGVPPRPPSPFFTIWRRDKTTDPWRYIAE